MTRRTSTGHSQQTSCGLVSDMIGTQKLAHHCTQKMGFGHDDQTNKHGTPDIRHRTESRQPLRIKRRGELEQQVAELERLAQVQLPCGKRVSFITGYTFIGRGMVSWPQAAMPFCEGLEQAACEALPSSPE